MRIIFERSGGFAGRRVQTRIDTSNLTAAQASQLQRLVAESGFFGLPGRLQSAEPKPDRFQYSLTVETGEGSHTVQASEEAVPQGMRPLLDWLSRFRQNG